MSGSAVGLGVFMAAAMVVTSVASVIYGWMLRGDEMRRIQADAERYRWLRDRLRFQQVGYSTDDQNDPNRATESRWEVASIHGIVTTKGPHPPQSLDAAIDAQRGGRGGT